MRLYHSCILFHLVLVDKVMTIWWHKVAFLTCFKLTPYVDSSDFLLLFFLFCFLPGPLFDPWHTIITDNGYNNLLWHIVDSSDMVIHSDPCIQLAKIIKDTFTITCIYISILTNVTIAFSRSVHCSQHHIQFYCCFSQKDFINSQGPFMSFVKSYLLKTSRLRG